MDLFSGEELLLIADDWVPDRNHHGGTGDTWLAGTLRAKLRARLHAGRRRLACTRNRSDETGRRREASATPTACSLSTEESAAARATSWRHRRFALAEDPLDVAPELRKRYVKHGTAGMKNVVHGGIEARKLETDRF